MLVLDAEGVAELVPDCADLIVRELVGRYIHEPAEIERRLVLLGEDHAVLAHLRPIAFLAEGDADLHFLAVLWLASTTLARFAEIELY